MFGLTRATRIFLRAGATDLRLGFDGLHGLVQSQLQQDVLSGHVFVFCNRSRTRIKALTWDGYATPVIMRRWEGSQKIVEGTERARSQFESHIKVRVEIPVFATKIASAHGACGVFADNPESCLFERKIGFDITVSGDQLLITEPQRDDLDRNAGLQKVHGGCVSEGMQ